MKTDQHALLFWNHVCGLHGDFCFQLSCSNEHVLVLIFYSQGTNWVINGPAGTLISWAINAYIGSKKQQFAKSGRLHLQVRWKKLDFQNWLTSFHPWATLVPKDKKAILLSPALCQGLGGKSGWNVFTNQNDGFLPVSTSVLTNNICGVSTSNSVTEATLHQKTLQITFHGGLYHPGFGDKVRIREPEKFPKFYAAFK